MLRGEERFALGDEMVQWTISSDERRGMRRSSPKTKEPGHRPGSYFLAP